MSEIRTPFEAFRDTDGTPLDGGYVYIGVENQEPITHPASIYWDSDLTIAAAQPIRTLGGYPVRAGAPAQVYVAGNYSITVKNKNGELVATLLSAGTLEALLTAVGGAGLVGYDDAEVYPDGTVGHAISSIPSAYVTYAADQAQTYRAFTSTGTAPAFVLTPSPALTAYVAGQRFRWKFHAAGTTGSNTGNISGLGAKSFKQYDSTGALVDGAIKSGMLADVEYDGTYLVILNPLPSGGGGGVSGCRGLVGSTTGTSAVGTWTVGEAIAVDSNGQAIKGTGLTLTNTLTSSGANGLDTGSPAFSTWYYIWAIYNPATATWASLASLSSTAPTLPTGYIHKVLISAIRTQSATNYYPLSMVQWGNRLQWKIASGANVATLPVMGAASGAAVGDVSAGPTVALAVGAFAPPNARAIEVMGVAASSDKCIMVAPNANYVGTSGGVNNHTYMWASGTYGQYANMTVNVLLQSSNIYWAASTGSFLYAVGFEMNF